MDDTNLIPQEPGVFTISGAMDFTTIDQLISQGRRLFDGIEPLIFLDLNTVSRANSAGLVLLLEWQDQALQRGRRLQIQNAPRALVDIAHISNCASLLGLE